MKRPYKAATDRRPGGRAERTRMDAVKEDMKGLGLETHNWVWSPLGGSGRKEKENAPLTRRVRFSFFQTSANGFREVTRRSEVRGRQDERSENGRVKTEADLSASRAAPA